ncbi:MAG: ATP-binding protein [Desulfamplus sp.]|nr:ATP-binding protein [Desulfamplus sp.]
MKKLPLGIQSFEKLRKDECVYIDKTQNAFNLVNGGTYFFLSRPRRFGKSLFLDTLHCLFQGKKELFEGLYIYDKWDWSKKYPVIRIDFAKGVLKTREELKDKILSIIKRNSEELAVKIEYSTPSTTFEDLITACYEKHKTPVVILIDEYDKPILDNITDNQAAIAMRDGLRDIYSVIKGTDKYIKFVFLTGVSKFSKMNLFSGLNNLQDITLLPEYGTICGYTQKDVEVLFKEHLQNNNVDIDELKRWYNGYSFTGESVYNPYDILLFFQEGGNFKSYWFETGTPTFLVDMIREKKYHLPDLENIEVSEQVLNTFDVGNIPIESLMFQTGYLTIKKTEQIFGNIIYTLSYPNFEVKKAFNGYIVGYLTEYRFHHTNLLYKCLIEDDFMGLKSQIERLLAAIPYSTHGNLYNYEGFYVSVVYSFLASLGIDLIAEDITNRGRADLTLKFPQNSKIYIFEFKVTEDDKSNSRKPLEQIKEKRYFEKYMEVTTQEGNNTFNQDRKIFLIGIEFSKNQRNIVGFEWEKVTC